MSLLKLKNKFIKLCTKFCAKEPSFWPLDALVCHFAANQYIEFAYIFSRKLKNSAQSKG